MNSPADPQPQELQSPVGGSGRPIGTGTAATGTGGASGAPAAEERDDRASVDAFYGGRFHLVQPKGHGFRAGLDALLLAASVPPERAGRAADLGSGSGALAFAVAARCPAMEIALVENDPVAAAFARRSLALAENRGLAPRLRLVEADVLARRAEREARGLPDGGWSTVITNPPFHPPTGRGSPDPLRAAARALPDAEFLPAWIRTAAALLETGGLLALIARPENLEDILVTARNRVGGIRILPVHAHEGRPAIRILVHARKGSRANLSLLPPIVLHGQDGRLTPLAEAVGAGEATIDLGLR